MESNTGSSLFIFLLLAKKWPTNERSLTSMDAASLGEFLSRTAQRRVRFSLEAAQQVTADAAGAARFRALEATRQARQRTAEHDGVAAAAAPAAPALALTATSRLQAASPIWCCERFLSPDECEALISLGKSGGCASRPMLWQPGASFPHRAGTKAMLEDQAMLACVRERAALVFGIPCDGPLSTASCQISFTAPEPTSPANSASIGLHVDQNNSNDDRWATVLVYLNSLPPSCGGCTVWPCADNSSVASALNNSASADDGGLISGDLVHDVDASGTSSRVIRSVQDASRHLLDIGVTCTSDALDIATDEADGSLQVALVPGTVAAAKLEEAATTNNQGVKTLPRMGRAVCFFSVAPTPSKDGVEIDVKSWHGGLSVAGASPVGKWTLQLFARFRDSATGAQRAAMVKAAQRHPGNTAEEPHHPERSLQNM